MEQKHYEEQQLYMIKSITVVNYLVKNGFNLIGVRNSNKGKGRIVFLFEDTPEFRNVLTRYTKLRKNN